MAIPIHQAGCESYHRRKLLAFSVKDRRFLNRWGYEYEAITEKKIKNDILYTNSVEPLEAHQIIPKPLDYEYSEYSVHLVIGIAKSDSPAFLSTLATGRI